MSGSCGCGLPRIEVLALMVEKIDIHMTPDHTVDPDEPTDLQNLCRVFLSDGFRLCEIYNPLKFENLFTDLPEQLQKSLKRRRVDDSISGPDSNAEEGLQDSSEKCEDSNSGPTYLPLTGPDDIRPYGHFNLIAHQNTYDDVLLEKVKPYYRRGYSAESGVVKSLAANLRPDYCELPSRVSLIGEFGKLSLDLIVFENSRLVTVTIKWFMDDIEGGDRGLKNDDTHETYICGNIYVVGRDAKQDEWTSTLLETPEDKFLKVVDGGAIVLMRSNVAVPFMSSFTVEAFLLDAINNIEIEGSATFHLTEGNKAYKLTESIVREGGGAKITVEAAMHANECCAKDFEQKIVPLW